MSLKDITTEELEAELSKRKEEKLVAVNDKVQKLNKLIVELSEIASAAGVSVSFADTLIDDYRFEVQEEGWNSSGCSF